MAIRHRVRDLRKRKEWGADATPQSRVSIGCFPACLTIQRKCFHKSTRPDAIPAVCIIYRPNCDCVPRCCTLNLSSGCCDLEETLMEAVNSVNCSRRSFSRRKQFAEFRSQRRHGPATSQLGHCCLQAPFFGSANQHLNNPRCQLDLLPPKPKNQRCTTTTRGRPTCRSFVRILSTNKAGFSAAGSDPARREDAALVRHWRSASCRSPGRCCQVQKQATSRTHQYQDVVFTLGPGEFTMYNNPKAVRPVRYPVVPSPSEDDPNHRSTPWMTFRQPRIASCFRF
jgi:hypothetical protein